MAGRYKVPGTLAAVGAAAKTIAAIVQPATVRTRPTVIGLKLGFNGTPADNAMLSDMVRCDATTAGTTTAVTPSPSDPADVASNLIANENYTVEPTTVGVTLAEWPQHQRTTILEQWDETVGDVLTGTASFKILVRTLHASYTGAASATITYRE
jgi:hypothetical protein